MYILLAAVFTGLVSVSNAQSPTAPAKDFNVFTLGNTHLSSNETEGPIAIGGDLTIAGSYQVAIHNAGTFKVSNVPIGLLVNGKVNYQSGNSLQVNSNSYVKIGNSNGSVVWYYDNNNAPSPIRVTPGTDYNGSPRIHLQANANQLGVGVNNNPVFQGGLIDFAAAFQTMKTSAASIAQCANNLQLLYSNQQPIPNNQNLPNQVKFTLQNGVNVLNINGSDMNTVQDFIYNVDASAQKVLVINVNAPGTFNWNVWNSSGIGAKSSLQYIIYNFYNTTQLNINGNGMVQGTIFAPYADVNKINNNSNIEGQVIANSLKQTTAEIHYFPFLPSLTGCAVPPAPPTPPVANFSINDTTQCLEGNSFVFTNTSTSALNPTIYAWDFGDGNNSTSMSPTHTYANAGTYNVSLTTTNADGSSTKNINVTVYASTTPVVTQNTTSSGNGSATKEFTITNYNNFTSVNWSLAGSTVTYNNQNPVSYTFTQAGYYEVTVSATNANGCVKSVIIPVTITSNEVTTGNNGGLESESLGDAVSKTYVHRKMNSVPTVQVKNSSMIFSKEKATGFEAAARNTNAMAMIDMFPDQLVAGNVAHTTSPTDILDYTIAKEVLSVDYSVAGKTKAVVLGVRTEDKVYNHTKASCDRLRGAEIMNVKTVQIQGYNFLMQAIKQRNGVTEYAISFAIGENNNANNYTIQTNWFVKEYSASKQVYNFQVWSVSPEYTQKLVNDIINNLKTALPVAQTEIQKMPKTYAAKVSRDGTDLVLKLKSTAKDQSIEIEMEEIYNETNGYALRYNPVMSQPEQTLRINIKDAYEYDGLIKVNGETQEAFYHADGNWGLDFDKQYTKINEYVVSNNFNRVYNADEYAVNRNVTLKVNTDDYITLYKSLLPANLPADYTDYGFVSFTATGSGLLEIGMVKSSITEWKHQYRANVNVVNKEKTYYIPFSFFKSTGTNNTITADDLSLLTFTFLPAQAGTKNLDLKISDVKFTKRAPAGYEDLLTDMRNEFTTYPNPSMGAVNAILFSDQADEATVTLRDITGKVHSTQKVKLEEGRNDLKFNYNMVTKGIMFMSISSAKTNYGTSKVMFK